MGLSVRAERSASFSTLGGAVASAYWRWNNAQRLWISGGAGGATYTWWSFNCRPMILTPSHRCAIQRLKRETHLALPAGELLQKHCPFCLPLLTCTHLSTSSSSFSSTPLPPNTTSLPCNIALWLFASVFFLKLPGERGGKTYSQ